MARYEKTRFDNPFRAIAVGPRQLRNPRNYNHCAPNFRRNLPPRLIRRNRGGYNVQKFQIRDMFIFDGKITDNGFEEQPTTTLLEEHHHHHLDDGLSQKINGLHGLEEDVSRSFRTFCRDSDEKGLLSAVDEHSMKVIATMLFELFDE